MSEVSNGGIVPREQYVRALRELEYLVQHVTPDRYGSVFAWGNNPRRAELKGRRCRVVARGSRMRSVLLEFENGERVVTSARAVRTP